MKKYFILLIFILLFFTSCSNSEEDIKETKNDSATVTDTTKAETNEKEILTDNLPNKNFENREFRISTLEENKYEVFSEEEVGDICNDTIFYRNRSVEERFNVKIVPKVYNDVRKQIEAVRNSVTAQDDEFDLVALFVFLSGELILSGSYQNWLDVDYVDFDKPWWAQKANEAFTVADKRYVSIGDFSVTSLVMTYGTFYNKRLVENYNISNLYQTVYDGKWTIDYLNTTVKDIYEDLNGNNEYDGDDLYGYTAERIINCDVMLPSFGQPITEKDAQGYPVVVINNPKTIDIVDKVYDLFYNNNGTWITEWDLNLPVFASGRAVFVTTYLDNAFNRFRNMEDEYGILPFPKYDEKQKEYLCDARDQYTVFGLPATVSDLEFVGIITEALTYESYINVYPAYYETALQAKYVSDSDSGKMIQLLIAGRNYDFSILHGEYLMMLPYLVRDLMGRKSTDFVSKYDSVEVQLNAKLNELIETYKNIEY